jgi:hypothetical protein
MDDFDLNVFDLELKHTEKLSHPTEKPVQPSEKLGQGPRRN